jgi:hypothetical protein
LRNKGQKQTFISNTPIKQNLQNSLLPSETERSSETRSSLIPLFIGTIATSLIVWTSGLVGASLLINLGVGALISAAAFGLYKIAQLFIEKLSHSTDNQKISPYPSLENKYEHTQLKHMHKISRNFTPLKNKQEVSISHNKKHQLHSGKKRDLYVNTRAFKL